MRAEENAQGNLLNYREDTKNGRVLYNCSHLVNGVRFLAVFSSGTPAHVLLSCYIGAEAPTS